MSEQTSAGERRPYQKLKRAEDEQQTRARIVDAAESLHGSLGPARTTISAVARAAGVTRVTVYRHFPDDEALFLACSGQWLARQRLPDPGAWTAYDEPIARLRAGLRDIYRYYRAGERMLTKIHRDTDAIPEVVRANRLRSHQLWTDTLLAPFPRRTKVLRAAVGHAAAFETWRSLCVAQSLSDRAAVDLMAAMVSTRLG